MPMKEDTVTLQERCLVETMAQVFDAEVIEPRPVRLADGAIVVTAHSLETLRHAGLEATELDANG